MGQNSRHTNEQSNVSLIITFKGLYIKAEIHKLTVCILPEVCWGHSQKISPGSSDDVGSPLAFYSLEHVQLQRCADTKEEKEYINGGC